MRLIPIGEHLIVKREDVSETTTGGILLPDSARGKPQKGRVLAVGDGLTCKNGRRVPHQVSEGDSVLFGKYSGSPVNLGNDELLILKESEILAIF